MRDESLDACPQPRDDGVVRFVSLAELSAWRCLTWGDDLAPLVTLVADSAARFSDDFGDRCGGERFRVMGASREGVGDVDGISIKIAVGTALAGGPLRRSQRALLTHWAPVLASVFHQV
jgi:hypothetical protein